jgi:LysM repeat protein
VNSYLFKIPIMSIVGLALAFILLSADRDAAAFPLLQASTPDRISVTPTIVATRMLTPIPSATISTQPISTPQADSSFYVVKPGDNLWTIATKVYGNGSQYVLIQRANNLLSNTVLHVGSTLTIPSLVQPTLVAPASTPTPTITPSITPLPTNTDNPSMMPVGVIVSATPLAVAETFTSPANLVSETSEFSWTPLIPIIQLSLNILSALCSIGACFCAFLAFESFQRSRPYIRRRYLGNRVRNGL